MLDERPYMRFRDDYGKHVRDAINAVWILIGLNVLVFLLGIKNVGQFALWADPRFFAPYQLITYMFLHGGFGHLFFNMYGLFIFGRLVAPVLGRQKFLWVYFISGICGGLLHLLANWNSVNPPIPTVGASGALFGVMMAVAMTKPNVEMYIMFIPMPVKMKTLVLVYAVLEIISSGRLDNIAHLAHLGGFIGAYIFIMIFCKRDVVWSLKDVFKGFSGGGKVFDRHAPGTPPGGSDNNDGAQAAPEPHITHVSQKEVDRLLDKISREGVNSLTDYERAELQHFREQMQSGGR